MNKVEKVARILASENSVNGYDEDDWGVWASQAKRIVMVAKWSLSDIAMIGVWCRMFDVWWYPSGVREGRSGRAVELGVFEVVELDWMRDPADMFFGNVKDVGYAPDRT